MRISNLFGFFQDTQHTKLEYGQFALLKQILTISLTTAPFSVVGKVSVQHYTITAGVVRGICAHIYINLYSLRKLMRRSISTVQWSHSNINTNMATITFGKLIFIVVGHYATIKFYITWIIKKERWLRNRK